MPNQNDELLKIRKEPVQQRSISRVQNILHATRKILREKGLSAVTTTRIARQAKIPVGSLYQYFPNKKAVLFALYSDYLEELRELLEVFEQDEYLELGWVEFFEKLLVKIKSVEQRDISELELFRALLVYPELQQLDQEHGQMTVDFTAWHLKRLGAQGSTAKLQRLGWYIYELNNAAWMHQARGDIQKHRAESIEWERVSLLSVLATVFPPSEP